MTFPTVKSIELANPPLELVICQLRFPPLLKLAAGEPPEDFQRQMSHTYPLSSVHRTVLQVHTEQRSEPDIVPTPESTWSFQDIEKQWVVSVGANFLALETTAYKGFNDFLNRFGTAIAALRSTYPLGAMQRLGLRYVDRFSRSKQQFLPESWLECIRSELLPLRDLASNRDAQQIKVEARHRVGDIGLTVQSRWVGSKFPGAKEEELVLDFDSYFDKVSPFPNTLEPMLLALKRQAYDAFRWAIDELITHFEPASRR